MLQLSQSRCFRDVFPLPSHKQQCVPAPFFLPRSTWLIGQLSSFQERNYIFGEWADFLFLFPSQKLAVRDLQTREAPAEKQEEGPEREGCPAVSRSCQNSSAVAATTALLRITGCGLLGLLPALNAAECRQSCMSALPGGNLLLCTS